MKLITLGCLALFIFFPGFRLANKAVSNPWPPAPDSNAVGKVVDVNGSANISRNNVRRPIPARRNVQLIRGDQVKVEGSSTVKIICFADFQPVSLQAGPHSDICGENQSADVFTNTLNRGRPEIITRPNGQVIMRPRANNYPDFLAKIIDARPEDWGSSISLKKLLPNDSRSDLVNRIQSLPATVSDDEKRLLLVDVYSMNKNYDRAIEELGAVSNAANDPLIQINLGDLYMASSQSGDAKRAYSSAIQAAISSDDPMAEALAQHAFGMLLRCEGARVAEATAALTRAIQLYKDLGEDHSADLLKTELGVSQSPSFNHS
jgi:hypothetical protein